MLSWNSVVPFLTKRRGGWVLGDNRYSLSCLVYGIKWDDGVNHLLQGLECKQCLGNAGDCYGWGWGTSLPSNRFCGKSQQCLTLDYIPETPWHPIRFLTETKVKVPIKSNSGFGEDSGGEMKMGQALLTGPHEEQEYGNCTDFDQKAGEFQVALSVFSITAAKPLCSTNCKSKQRGNKVEVGWYLGFSCL